MNSDSEGVSGSDLKPASNYFIYSITYSLITFIFVVFFVATFLTSFGANDPTAKEKLNQVNQAALAVASDAKLVLVSGDDLSIDGKSSLWIYNYKSESKNKAFEFWYENGSLKQKTTISSWDDLHATPGMLAIPDNWIDSNSALSIAESNGGSNFRTSHGNNAAIRVSLMPSAIGSTGDVPLLYPKTVWLVSYRANDNYFDVILDAITGDVLKYGRTTAKAEYPFMYQLATEFASDAKLIELFGLGVTIDGKSDEMNYVFQSVSQQITFNCGYRQGKIKRDAGSPIQNIAVPLTESWMDSDSALILAEAQGGLQFRNSHPGYEIVTRLTKDECNFSRWEVMYNSPTGSENYFVYSDAIQNLVNTSLKQFENVKVAAKVYANDAQLVFVTSPDISLAGSAEWQYVFKSVSQQEVYQFISKPNGLICPSEEISKFLSKEDYLRSIPLPDLWIDIDSALVITENSGGLGFRQSNPDWSIAAYLLIGPENNGFNWEIKYNSNSAGQKGFSVNAKITVKILADYFLQKADSLAKLIKEDVELVYVSGKFIDSNGKADRWSYYYKSMSNQEAYNYYTESGSLYLSNEVETQSVIDYMLSLDKLPDNWINSDIFITYAEQEGGTKFRQANPDWTINAYLREHNRFSEFHWQVQYLPGPENYWIDALHPQSSGDWPKTYGGENSDMGYSIQKTNDGGFVIAGNTSSFGNGMTDGWLIETDENGHEIFSRSYGGELDNFGIYAQKTEEGGYLAAFNQISTAGVSTASFIQTDPAGNEGYRRQFETDGNSIVKSFYKTDENARILAGSTSFLTSESYDFWLIKIKELGDVSWNYNYGGTGDDQAESMSMTSDGGFIILGTTNSYGAGQKDLWLVKTDENGNKLWDKTYGGPLNDGGKSLVVTSDGGLILAGYTESFGEGGKDFYIIKTDENGNEIWSRTFGSSEDDFANDVIEADDGSYIIVGTTKQLGNEDIWIIKTDLSGDKEWEHITGGDEADTGEAICETRNGDFLVTGSTSSWGAGQSDVILMKIENTGHVTGNEKSEKLSNKVLIQNYPNPFTNETIIRINTNLSGHFKIRILDVTGREISVLTDGFLHQGQYEISWNGTTKSGVNVKPGIYFCELTGNINKRVLKMCRVK